MSPIHTSQTTVTVTRQIDPGSYHVRATTSKGAPLVGMVFAEGVAGKHIVEHWVLSEGHASPTVDQHMVVEPTDEEHASLAAFFTAMRAQSREWQKVTYIKASCQYYDAIPEL